VKQSEFDDLMAGYLDGSLSPRERARLEEQLRADPEAAREARELRRVGALLRELPDPEPPSGLADAALRRLRAERERPGPWAAFARWWSERGPMPLAGPAVAFAAAGLVLWMGRAPEPAPTAPAQVARAPGSAARELPAPARSEAALPPLRISPLAEEDPLPPRRAGGWQPPAIAGAPASRETGSLVTAPRGGAGIGLVTTPTGPSHAPAGLPSAEKRARGNAELDRRLQLAVRDPLALAELLRGDSLAAQEHWLRRLAERAVETEMGSPVLEALRRSGDWRVHELAGPFATALERVRGDVIAREAGRP